MNKTQELQRNQDSRRNLINVDDKKYMDQVTNKGNKTFAFSSIPKTEEANIINFYETRLS